MNFSELNALPDLGQNKSLFEIVITTKTYSLFLIIIPLLTIFGNGLVILAVFRERALQTVTNMLIVSLAVSDMLIGTFVMTFAVYFEVCFLYLYIQLGHLVDGFSMELGCKTV
jgi:hypothetical protein